MAKTLTFQLISLFLVVSLTAPSIIAVLDIEGENYVVVNINEEEEKEQNEIKFDATKLYYEKKPFPSIISFGASDNSFQHYANLSSSFSIGIELPPPEWRI